MIAAEADWPGEEPIYHDVSCLRALVMPDSPSTGATPKVLQLH